MKIGDTTASYLHYLLHTAEALGADTDMLLRDVGLEKKALQDGDERIDLTYLMRIGYYAIQRTNEPSIGLMAGSRSSITRFGIAGLAAMTAPTLGDALRIITDYEDLYGRCYRGSSSLTREGDHTWLNFYSISPYNDYTFFVVDAVLSGWAHAVQWLTGRNDLVEAAHIEFSAPPYAEDYKKAFNCPVVFNQDRNALKLKDNVLETPLIHENRSLHQYLLEQCELAISRVALASSYRNKVLKVLGTMLHGKTPSIEEVAQELGIPTWTLRRKLKDEDTSYQALVDEMRRDVALSYMRNTDLSFGEISYLLGFSTPGAFQRAFKRWAGTTPGEYRKSLLNKD
ncbi:MAG: AraC family transcriptional regulator ligand-binding domain-containing protein [Ketobacteraceae bacterium]|nr:AraC family transcriptional regulator ligand-binding domain-containing protein [Ketobacteraceae bacterium]